MAASCRNPATIIQKPLDSWTRPYGLAEGLLTTDASQDHRHHRLCTVNGEVCPALARQKVCQQYAGWRKLHSAK